MAFGYFVAETALRRPLPGPRWAWAGFWMAVAGVVLAVLTIASGSASVLYTFYPPLTASVWSSTSSAARTSSASSSRWSMPSVSIALSTRSTSWR